MITGIHALIYSNDADKDRAFFRDVLNFHGIDSGGGWLIFALPPGEMGIHPADGEEFHEMCLMCGDLEKTISELNSKGVECTAPQDRGWGIATSLTLPSGGRLGMYQPKHPTAIGMQ